MGVPREHIPVKLIVGFITPRPDRIIKPIKILERKFGKADRESPFFDFSCTAYYKGELGENLKKKFFSFKNLIPLKDSHKIKLLTNKIEGERRLVNIDPGYISLAKLVLFTTKNRSHRIYLDKGIYADLELVFEKKTFCPLEWTYPDYRTKEYIDFFNSVRATYRKELKHGD